MNRTPKPLTSRALALGVGLLVLALATGVASPIAESQQTEAPLSGLPGTADSVRVRGGMLHYISAGHGLAVILLAGGPGYSGTMLEPVYAHVALHDRAVLLDQRGTGRSSAFADSTSFTLATAVDDIERVRVKLGVARVVLLGHSWGGTLATAYVAEHPTHVDGLILVGAGSLRPRSTDAIISQRLRARLSRKDVDSIRALSALLPDPAKRDSALRAIRLLNWKAYEYDPANVRLLAERLSPHSFSERTARWMYSDLLRSGPAAARQLTSNAAVRRIPVLIVYGDVDAIGLTTVSGLRGAFPEARVAVIPRSGHHPWNEAPSTFYAAVDAFLRQIR